MYYIGWELNRLSAVYLYLKNNAKPVTIFDDGRVGLPNVIIHFDGTSLKNHDSGKVTTSHVYQTAV